LGAPASDRNLIEDHPAKMVREIFGARPDPWQEEALELFPTTPRIAMKACKGPGKSTVLAWLAWNYLLTRPHPKIAMVRWIFGNPLIAITMIRHDLTAGLFAPVEILVTEAEDGLGTTITYVTILPNGHRQQSAADAGSC
jgi:Domain of unknown function DUF302